MGGVFRWHSLTSSSYTDMEKNSKQTDWDKTEHYNILANHGEFIKILQDNRNL